MACSRSRCWPTRAWWNGCASRWGSRSLIARRFRRDSRATRPALVPLDVAGRSLKVTCVSMGNPHCVTFVDEITDDLVLRVGPQIERHPAFPNRVNAEFVKVLSRTETVLRVLGARLGGDAGVRHGGVRRRRGGGPGGTYRSPDSDAPARRRSRAGMDEQRRRRDDGPGDRSLLG